MSNHRHEGKTHYRLKKHHPLTLAPIKLLNIVVTVSQSGLRAKRESGAPDGNAGAAPATVSGESTSHPASEHITAAGPLKPHGFGKVRMPTLTREPGDLPRHHENVLGRGVPVVA